MTRVLFIHQNLPGQLRRSMRSLPTRPDHVETAGRPVCLTLLQPLQPPMQEVTA